MIQVIPDLPEGVLGFAVSGRVTAEDYENVLIPAVEAAAADHGDLRLVYHVTPDFESFAGGAMWDDAKVGLTHLLSWKKIAFVTDSGWIADSVKALGFALPGHVRVFGEGGLAEAKAWAAE